MSHESDDRPSLGPTLQVDYILKWKRKLMLSSTISEGTMGYKNLQGASSSYFLLIVSSRTVIREFSLKISNITKLNVATRKSKK